MSNNQGYIEILLKKFQLGECNEEELKFIDDWYNSLNYNVEEDNVNKKEIKQKSWDNVLLEIAKGSKKKKEVSGNFKYLSGIAAVLIITISLGIWSIKRLKKDDVTPYYLTAYVAKGEKILRITLPDSSVVWVNNGSSIKYPSDFKTSRNVQLLEGEAFFSVKHDSLNPFSVSTPSGIIARDLGTEFDVKAYGVLNTVKIAVLSGSVAVGDSSKTLSFLNSNEEAVVDKVSKSLQKSNIENNKIDAWKNGEIVMNDVSLEEFILTVENNYNVLIKCDMKNFKKCRINMSFKSSDNLKDILHAISLIYKSNYKIDKGIITIYGRGCS